ncbi:MAG: TRAP transporter substrate-binding protein [Proteobacteria bacterium]|nr:TRAP transporter substrate-binding protein [Burkholderiales bacterium]
MKLGLLRFCHAASVVLGTAALIGVAGGVAAQTRWDLPTGYPDSIFHTVNLRAFTDEVRKATNGQLDITLHTNAALIKLPDITRAVQTGQVAIGEILLSTLGNEDPFLEADGIPFLAVGFDQAYRLYQVQKPYVDQRMEKRGLRVLYSIPWPGQNVFTRVPWKSLDEMKGVRFRAYNPATARLAELMGATPTTVQAAEIPQAFATGVVAAMITSGTTGVASKSWEFSKFYYRTSAFHPRNVVFVNERAFQRLPKDHQQIVLTAAANAEKRGWLLARETDQESEKTMAKAGMQILDLDPALGKALLKIGEQMQQEWVKRAGPDGEKMLNQLRTPK